MTISKRFVVVMALLATAGCSFFSHTQGEIEENVLTPSQLNDDPSRYHRHEIVVKGFVLLSSGSHGIYESKELFEQFSQKLQSDRKFNPGEYDKYCLTIANPDQLWADPEKFRDKTVVFRGVFIKDYLRDDRIDLGACSQTAIVID